ncbi:MAG: NADP-dependent phosphogluconate dehydrogenase [Candidatus Hodarchaeales archaeon]|jgi:6-phosphogluconate dehydrogenase
MEKADIGLIGLASMGRNIARNIEMKGFSVAIYNRTNNKVQSFLQEIGGNNNFIACDNIGLLCKSVKKPRKIMLMIKAGDPVDKTIKQLVPFLTSGDIIIDAGNSFFKDTIKREIELKKKGIQFMGVGVSGGNEGALKGPSIMPGGSRGAWDETKDLLQKIAAKTIEGEPCCEYLGSDGAGHFVKMVHNGIEYCVMQLIAESYFVLQGLLSLKPNQLSKIFEKWNEGELNSYLIEITKHIMSTEDPISKNPLIDVILDRALQKGTGLWSSLEALKIGIFTPSITEAVFARIISSIKEERLSASEILKGPNVEFKADQDQLLDSVRKGLFSSIISSFAQGFALLRGAEENYGWKFNFNELAKIWSNGTIIRAKVLSEISKAYNENPELRNLLLAPYFHQTIENYQKSWRQVIIHAIKNGIPIPGFSSALAYYDSYRSPKLPANLIQAQRDYFGSHTYERIDEPRGTFFHFDKWPEIMI